MKGHFGNVEAKASQALDALDIPTSTRRLVNCDIGARRITFEVENDFAYIRDLLVKGPHRAETDFEHDYACGAVRTVPADQVGKIMYASDTVGNNYGSYPCCLFVLNNDRVPMQIRLEASPNGCNTRITLMNSDEI